MEKKFALYILQLLRNYIAKGRLRNRISKVGNLNQNDMNKAMRGKGTSLMLIRIVVGLATLIPEDEFRRMANVFVEYCLKIAKRIKQSNLENIKKNEL